MHITQATYRDIFDRKKNLDFFTDLASEAGRALDLGAGTGRVTLAMANAGARVTAVESNASLRAILKKNLERVPPEISERIELMRGDVLSFTTARQYPLVILSGLFETLYTREQRFQALNHFHGLLESGGRLVFDLFSVNIGEFSMKEIDRITDDNKIYIRKMACAIDRNEQVALLDLAYETISEGNLIDQTRETTQVALVEPNEISEGLMEAGFRSFEFYGDYDRRDYDLYSRILVVEAWRR